MFLLAITVFILSFNFSSSSRYSKYPIKSLTENGLIRCCDLPLKDLEIYCYGGRDKHIVHIWETVQLQISLNPDQYEYFEGCTPNEVIEEFESKRTSWNFNFYLNRRKFIKLDPFNNTCVGISTDQQNYDVKLNRIRVDYWRILLFALGLILFITAPKLSSNSLFYYITGVSVGTCASMLILIYIMSRFFPRKPVMYSFLAGGWITGLYLAQLVFDNIRTIVLQYKAYVIYYVIITGIVSFVICYRFGPVTDPRSINLIKWALQVAGLSLMFFSSDFQEASMAICILLLVTYNLPLSLMCRSCLKLFKWWRPVRPRLLTDEEYHQQAAVETERALEDLRGYCSSPECNQWRTVLKLKDPLRFAKFMEGNSHIQDEEILAYHEEDVKVSLNDMLTDDSSEDD